MAVAVATAAGLVVGRKAVVVGPAALGRVGHRREEDDRWVLATGWAIPWRHPW